jgi:hypothetical protein
LGGMTIGFWFFPGNGTNSADVKFPSWKNGMLCSTQVYISVYFAGKVYGRRAGARIRGSAGPEKSTRIFIEMVSQIA